MWILLALLALVLLVGLAGVLYLLYRRKPALAVSNEMVSVVSLGLNVVVLFIAIFSLIVAMAAYQSAEESGHEQQRALEKQYKTLDSSRLALESVVSVAQKQQAALDRAIQVSETHLKLAEQQRKEELERRGRRPKLEVSLGAITSSALRSGERVNVLVNEQRELSLGFLIKNVGKASVTRPVMLFRASPEAVSLYEQGPPGSMRAAPNVLQFTGPNVMDLLPSEQNPHGYRIAIKAVVPKAINAFDMEVSIFGDNLSAEMLKIGFNVFRPPPKQ